MPATGQEPFGPNRVQRLVDHHGGPQLGGHQEQVQRESGTGKSAAAGHDLQVAVDEVGNIEELPADQIEDQQEAVAGEDCHRAESVSKAIP